MIFLLMNVLFFQLIWWSSALSWLKEEFLILLTVFLIFFQFQRWSQQPTKDYVFIALVAVIGYALDILILQGRVFILENSWPSLWLFSVWLAFASTLVVSLKGWIIDSKWGYLIGPLGAVFSYLAAEKLGRLNFIEDKIVTVLVQGMIWLIGIYFIRKLYRRFYVH